jgi:4-hydroxy-4-methyl-2-oxoglutarate aldolase
MIEDPPLLTVKTNFARPTATQLAAFKEVGTGVVVDCLGGRGAIQIKPVNPDATTFTGVAMTCDCGPADNLAVFAALKYAQPGDVIAVATGGYTATAVVGDMVVGMARNCGASALITDGYVRDTDGVCKAGLPCFAAGSTPNSPARNGPGTAGLPIVMDDVVINSGDVIVADRDGVVVVPLACIDQVVSQLPEVLAAEAALEVEVEAGLKLPEFVTELLSGDRVRKLDD